MKTIHDFPRVHLTAGPTPLQKLENLSRKYGKEIYVKRDDMTGVGLGGNKVRKLEFLLADAKARGADVVFTTGGAQSNHAMLTAACCNKLGMRAILILKKRGVWEGRKGNLLLNHLLGAEVQFLDTDSYEDVYAEMRRQGALLEAEGHVPYYIPVGGSTPLGSLGYIACMEEAYGQAREMGVHFDHTVCVCGSGGTAAGVALGTRYFSPDTKVLAVAVDDDPFEQIVPQLMRGAMNLLEDPSPLEEHPLDIQFHVGAGYGIAGPEDTEAVKEMARLEGIFLDGVYTGKAFAHFLSLLEQGAFPGEKILFVHSGGAGGLFAVELPE